MNWFSIIMGFLLGSIMTSSSNEKNWLIFIEASICLVVLILHTTGIW